MSDRGVEQSDVEHLASLARIAIDDDKLSAYVEECGTILEYFDRLEEVPETERITKETNVFRADISTESLPQEKALENASSGEDGYFRGPPVS